MSEQPKPSAWIGPLGQTMTNEVYESFASAHQEDAKQFRPLYDRAALDKNKIIEQQAKEIAGFRGFAQDVFDYCMEADDYPFWAEKLLTKHGLMEEHYLNPTPLLTGKED